MYDASQYIPYLIVNLKVKLAERTYLAWFTTAIRELRSVAEERP
jgi:hypothetical protein